MAIMKRPAGVLAVLFTFVSLGAPTVGCGLLKGGGDETEDDKKKDEKKEEPPPPEPTASASASSEEDLGDVESYPEMTKAGGTFRLLRAFQVYQAADESSKRLTGLARNTLVDFKFFYKDWIMVNWPSGPGELSPGWIHIKPQDRGRDTKQEEKKEEPDAGIVPDAGIPDAGTVVPDAGVPVPDAGAKTRPIFKLRIPPKK